MRLYVCWGNHREPFHQHPCRLAFRALRAAGHEPEVRKVRGLGVGPRFLHWMTAGRREVERISGQRAVPVLVSDDGEVIAGSAAIVTWSEANRNRGRAQDPSR